MLRNSETMPPARALRPETAAGTVTASARTRHANAVRLWSVPRAPVPGHEATDHSRAALLREAIGAGTYPLNPRRIAAGLIRMERALAGYGAAMTLPSRLAHRAPKAQGTRRINKPY